MEPITTTWLLTTLISGFLGNRTDHLLCKGANHFYRQIRHEVNEPANQNIQRAVRKSYLQATWLAADHIQKQKNRYSLSNRSWKNFEEIKSFIKDQIDQTTKKTSNIPNTELDTKHQQILFPKEGATSSDRMPELIQNFKDSIIRELEKQQLRVESALKDCINNGWKEGSREMDFYKLTCSFFTQELKENTTLSTYIQTEYLDQINVSLGEVSFQMEELSRTLMGFYEEYKEVVNLLQGVLFSLEDIQKTLGTIPEQTAKLVQEAIDNNIITPRQMTISEQYQHFLKDLDEISSEIASIRMQMDGVKNAISQVDDATKNNLSQNLQNLEMQLLQKSISKEEREKVFNIFVQNVINLARQLSHADFLDSERLQKAKALFEAGKYEELNEVLNEEEIDKDIQKYKKKGKALAYELTIKAQTIVLTKPVGWFEQADRLFEKALGLIENYYTTFNYANFLADHKQILKAAELFEKTLLYVSNDIQRANTLNNLGKIQYNKNEFEQAVQSHQEALVIYRKLAAINPQTYLPNIGNSLNNLGASQHKKYEFEQAEQSWKEALAIRRKLAAVNPQTYLPEVAATLTNSGLLQHDKNDFGRAEQSYQEALGIFRKLADINPQTFLPNVVMILINLGPLQYKKSEYEQGEQSLKEALKICRKLAADNPHTYLTYLAITLNNLGILQIYQKKLDQAEQSYKEALYIRRKLAGVNPQTYLISVAESLNNMGLLYQKKSKFEQEEQSYQEAIEIYRQLEATSPSVYSIPYADSLLNLAQLYNSDLINQEKSIFFANEALRGYGPFKNKVPEAAKGYKEAKAVLDYWNQR
ncbi:MAG: tetratricopeptide repeat protein [Fulvivirga sp.]